MGGLFRLRNTTVVGYFYYLIVLKLLNVSVVRPSSIRNILARIYSTDSEKILANIFLPEDGRTTETCSSLSNNK
jgi:hypothetical protein